MSDPSIDENETNKMFEALAFDKITRLMIRCDHAKSEHELMAVLVDIQSFMATFPEIYQRTIKLSKRIFEAHTIIENEKTKRQNQEAGSNVLP